MRKGVKYDRDRTTLLEVLKILPNIRNIRNENLNELIISEQFDFIPYLSNFPSLKRIEILSDLNWHSHIGYATGNTKLRLKREFQDLRDCIPARKQKIKDYCAENGIELVSTIN